MSAEGDMRIVQEVVYRSCECGEVQAEKREYPLADETSDTESKVRA